MISSNQIINYDFTEEQLYKILNKFLSNRNTSRLKLSKMNSFHFQSIDKSKKQESKNRTKV